MMTKNSHVAHLVPGGFRQGPVLDALAKLSPPDEFVCKGYRTSATVGGKEVTVQWDTDDGDVMLLAVYAGPVELLNTDWLSDEGIDKCHAAAERDREARQEMGEESAAEDSYRAGVEYREWAAA